MGNGEYQIVGEKTLQIDRQVEVDVTLPPGEYVVYPRWVLLKSQFIRVAVA